MILSLPIFKEINYLSHDQFREMNERLKRFEEQPEIVRKKIKGDYLVDHEKYINAIQVYQETLKDTEENETNMGSQFTGSIYNNMAVPTQGLFQMNEALMCFQKANEELHTKASLKSWLFAVYMSKGQDAYEQMCTERESGCRDETGDGPPDHRGNAGRAPARSGRSSCGVDTGIS